MDTRRSGMTTLCRHFIKFNIWKTGSCIQINYCNMVQKLNGSL